MTSFNVSKRPGLTFRYGEDRLFKNKLTGLCMDAMRFDHATYPDANGGKHPVSLQLCGKSGNQKVVLTYVSVTENAKAAEERMHKAGVVGH